jgi:hypothetical protein
LRLYGNRESGICLLSVNCAFCKCRLKREVVDDAPMAMVGFFISGESSIPSSILYFAPLTLASCNTLTIHCNGNNLLATNVQNGDTITIKLFSTISEPLNC